MRQEIWHVDHRGEIRHPAGGKIRQRRKTELPSDHRAETATSAKRKGRYCTSCSPCSSASQAILDRAYGKAPTFSTTDTTQFKRAIDMTDDELAAIAGRAKLTIVKLDT